MYISLYISEREHPTLYQYVKQERIERKAGERLAWGRASKFICDTAEKALKKEDMPQEAQIIAEIQKSLDEIKTLLKSGVVLQEHEEQIVKESSKISDALSKLSFGGL